MSEPVLRVFPKILTDRNAFHALLSVWNEQGHQTLKGLKAVEQLKTLVLKVWPMFTQPHNIALDQPHMEAHDGDQKNTAQQRAEKIKDMLLRDHYSGTTAGSSSSSADMTSLTDIHSPFHIQEIAFERTV